MSRATTLATPVGDLAVDTATVGHLLKTRPDLFRPMTQGEDEDEHSIEMQLPMIARVFARRGAAVSCVPIMIGSTSREIEREIASVLAPYLASSENVFVISSDFCHWGSRFRYTYGARGEAGPGKPIYAAVEDLDRQAMGLIERKDTTGYLDYLDATKNTICGRHPIGVLLAAINILETTGSPSPALASGPRTGLAAPWSIRFLSYAQSSKVVSKDDSSVSYAAAVATQS